MHSYQNNAIVQTDENEEVLILVLMEDALVQPCSLLKAGLLTGLNPCFNGRCTRTEKTGTLATMLAKVLILVLMEDALVH